MARAVDGERRLLTMTNCSIDLFYYLGFGFWNGDWDVKLRCVAASAIVIGIAGRCGKNRNFTIFLDSVADFRDHLILKFDNVVRC